MASSTLQEFLVQLGFKIDEPQLGKFTSSLLSVSKQVVGISLALEGAAIALTAFTTLELSPWAVSRTTKSTLAWSSSGTRFSQPFPCATEQRSDGVETR